MHEQTLVRGLLRQVEELLAAESATTVRAIHVRIGTLSGVEPLLFLEAFQQLSAHTFLDGAELKLIEEPLEAACRDCGKFFQPVNFRFECPACGSRRVECTRGESILLDSITVAEPETTGASAWEEQP